MIDLDFENRCKTCHISTHCPIGNRPLGLSFENEDFKLTCENLVELYKIFVTIGGMQREYKTQGKHDPQ